MPLLFALYIALIPSPVIRLMDTYCFTSRTELDYFRISLAPRNDWTDLAVCPSGFEWAKIEGRG